MRLVTTFIKILSRFKVTEFRHRSRTCSRFYEPPI